MATQYFIATSQQVAKTQNRTWWERILGRAKFPQDVTEFLFTMIDHPTDGRVLIVVEQKDYDRLYPLLTNPEKNFVDNNILQETDPAVIAFKADLAAANPPLVP